MSEDYFTHAEADAGRYAARFADYDDDRPSLSDLADDVRDPLWDALIDAIADLNRADAALSDALYGPSNWSRSDVTRLENERDAAQDRAREAVIAWKFPER